MTGKDVDVFMMEIGTKEELNSEALAYAADTWLAARQSLPRCKVWMFAVGGYDDDPREIYEIPEAVNYVQAWARAVGLDDEEKAARIFDNEHTADCLFVLRACQVFGSRTIKVGDRTVRLAAEGRKQ